MDKIELNEEQTKFLMDFANNNDLCKICKLRNDCNGLVGTPNGPHFPFCADWSFEYYVDVDLLNELMEEK